MPQLNPLIPRAPEPERFLTEPLGFLARMREDLGDVFVLREDGPILSRTSDCSGVVAVFGAQHHRGVLGDIETFCMPPSAAKQLLFDEKLTNLNRSLHSMHGAEHTAQKRVLMSALDTASLDQLETVAGGACEEMAERWKGAATIRLLREMRNLTTLLASRLLFGEEYDGREELAGLLSSYFHLRRQAASPAGGASHDARDTLLVAGDGLDSALRRFVRTARGSEEPSGLIGKLAAPKTGLTEDEIAGHANILFVSSTEPIAVALTWTLLILSQLPQLRQALREEIASAGHPSLLDSVIAESLRILPPNAIMVRVTARPVSLGGVELPARCEVILCPWVTHRDARLFPEPDAFRPSRWIDARPSPFEYLPFGAGGHLCVGRGLALGLMKAVLSFLVARYDLVLAGDQEVDWRVHIMFMPRNDPAFLIRAPHASGEGGTLRGPLAALLSLAMEP
jgi:cytochrome P450